MRAMLRLTTVLFSLAVFSAPGSRAAAPVDTQGPLTIQSQGSFFVGGTVRHAEDLGGAASGPEVTRSGDITTGQMYVQYQIPVRPAHMPVVMVHGGGLSGQATTRRRMAKGQLASDRSSCRSALANQVRLVLHTAAYWLMLTVRDAILKPQPLATAEFATLQLRLLRSPGVSRRPPHGSASRSPRPAPKPTCSGASRAVCNSPGPDGRGIAPEPASSDQPQRPAPPHPTATKSAQGRYAGAAQRRTSASTR